MNKEQQTIAQKVIKYMKVNNGYIYRKQLDNFIKYGDEQLMIIKYISDNGGLGLIKSISKEDVYSLTPKGNQFTNFDELEKISKKAEERDDLEMKNMRLENENLEYQKSIRNLNNDIAKLTETNLKLQNKHLKKYILYSVISLIIGVLMANWREIIKLFGE